MTPAETTALWSLIVSLGALAVSIIAGFLNWRHTERKFVAETQADIEVLLEAPFSTPGRDSYLFAEISNLSSNISVRDVNIQMSFAPIERKFFFWKKWQVFAEEKIRTISPNRREGCHLGNDEVGIEHHLTRMFPTHIERSEEGYRMLKKDPLAVSMLLEVRYRPAIVGARERKITQYYELYFHSEDTPGHFLWSLFTPHK